MSTTEETSSPVNGPKPLTTSLGKLLLIELCDAKTADVDKVLDYLTRDPLSGRLKDSFGDNCFHIVLGGGFRRDFVIRVIDKLIEVCPEGLRVPNASQSLPLHLCFCRYVVIPEVTLKVLHSYSKAAEIRNALGLIPLFLCVMRDDSSAELCKALCKANPAGPSTMNTSSHTYPIHYAAKRANPNREVIKVLLRRFPAGASHANDFGCLPLHCLCSSSDDVETAKLLLECYPDALRLTDLQGRTCLHLAVLAIGKEHSEAVTQEANEFAMEQARIQSQRRIEDAVGSGKMSRTIEQYPDVEDDTDDEEEDGEEPVNRNNPREAHSRSNSEMTELTQTRTRKLVKFLVEAYPPALTMNNNFFFTPVQTVLAKTKTVKTKKKVVTVFGLADDSPTARILLIAQQHYAREEYMRKKYLERSYRMEIDFDVAPWRVGTIQAAFQEPLRELNWLTRKDILLASLAGTPRPGSTDASLLQALRVAYMHAGNTTDKANNSVLKKKQPGVLAKIGGKSKQNLDPATVNRLYSMYLADDSALISKNNLLARLRRRGMIDTLRLIISWI